jgi:hypothetical protein
MRFGKFVSAAILIALTGTTARAESISFDFTDVLLGVGPSFSYSKGGLTLNVTGTNKIGSNAATSALITRSLLGLGVVGAPTGNPLGMDNVGSVESLIFDFSPHQVVINKMSFKFIDKDSDNDEVLLTVWGNGANTTYDISTQGTGSVNFDFTKATPLRTAEQRTGMKFVASTTDWNDNYTIAGLVVDYMKYVPPPVILPPSNAHVAPLPSSVWGGGLLLSLSGWIVWARKRRNGGEITSA